MAKVQFKYRPPPEIVPSARDREPPPPETPDLDASGRPAKVDRWWYESSWDLRRGLEVSDDADTVPAELLDELFAPPAPRRKPGGS